MVVPGDISLAHPDIHRSYGRNYYPVANTRTADLELAEARFSAEQRAAALKLLDPGTTRKRTSRPAKPLAEADIKTNLAAQAEEAFVKERTELHLEVVRVQGEMAKDAERTRRVSLYLAAALIAVACLIPLLAPPGREVISWIVGAALFVFAAGAIGYTRLHVDGSKKKLNVSRD